MYVVHAHANFVAPAKEQPSDLTADKGYVTLTMTPQTTTPGEPQTTTHGEPQTTTPGKSLCVRREILLGYHGVSKSELQVLSGQVTCRELFSLKE
jgi:hypothetical protein